MIFNFFKKEHKYAELVFETFGPTLKLIKLKGKLDILKKAPKFKDYIESQITK